VAGVALTIYGQPLDQGVADQFGVWGQATGAAVCGQQESEPSALFAVERPAGTGTEQAAGVVRMGMCVGHDLGVSGCAGGQPKMAPGRSFPSQDGACVFAGLR
jgi:hypothetical protein